MAFVLPLLAPGDVLVPTSARPEAKIVEIEEVHCGPRGTFYRLDCEGLDTVPHLHLARCVEKGVASVLRIPVAGVER